MFCTRCGLAVQEGTRFCTSCGQEVGVRPPAAQVVTPTPPPPVMASAPPPPVVSTAPVAGPLPYGGFWVRFVALMIDGLVLGIPFTFIVIIFVFLMGGFALIARRLSGLSGLPRTPGDPQAAMVILGPLIMGYFLVMIIFLVVEWLYFAGMESSERQATFGKAAMSLRVTGADGRRLSFGHASGRFFSKIVSGLVPLGIGYIMAGFTAKKQALHDMIAGTLVMKR
jgi:uncharacterized RDD family membrane protein YckC